MHRDLLAGGYVQVDETPVKCNDAVRGALGIGERFLEVGHAD